MGLAEVLEHVQELVDGVAGAGRCHLYRWRLPSVDLLIATGQPAASTVPDLHLWAVDRGASPGERVTTGTEHRRHEVTIEGWRQVRDPASAADAASVGVSMTSAATHSAMAEAVRDALRDDAALHGGPLAVGCSPASLVTWSERDACADLLASEVQGAEPIWCHYCLIAVTVEVRGVITRT